MSKYHKVDMQLVLCCTKDGTAATPKRSLAEGLFEKTNDMQIGVARHLLLQVVYMLPVWDF